MLGGPAVFELLEDPGEPVAKSPRGGAEPPRPGSREGGRSPCFSEASREDAPREHRPTGLHCRAEGQALVGLPRLLPVSGLAVVQRVMDMTGLLGEMALKVFRGGAQRMHAFELSEAQ